MASRISATLYGALLRLSSNAQDGVVLLREETRKGRDCRARLLFAKWHHFGWKEDV